MTCDCESLEIHKIKEQIASDLSTPTLLNNSEIFSVTSSSPLAPPPLFSTAPLDVKYRDANSKPTIEANSATTLIHNGLQGIAEAALGVTPQFEYYSSSSSENFSEDIDMSDESNSWEDIDDGDDTALAEVSIDQILEIEAESQIEEVECDPGEELTQLSHDDNSVYQKEEKEKEEEETIAVDLPNGSEDQARSGRKLLKCVTRSTIMSSLPQSSGSWLSISNPATGDFIDMAAYTEEDRLEWEDQMKWKALDEYEDGLREAGFTLVDAEIPEEFQLPKYRKLELYRVKVPSGLRRCWIVPEKNITTKKSKKNFKFRGTHEDIDTELWDYFGGSTTDGESEEQEEMRNERL
jgi:hypothetical protein